MFNRLQFNALLILIGLNGSLWGHTIMWPVDDQKYYEVENSDVLIQATKSGKLISGKYGMTRNEGRRFHEGVDIKASKRDKKNEPTNKILSILPGKVVHINNIAGNSSYGKYLVIEHEDLTVPVYSLYAHLKSIESNIRVGTRVIKGTPIGVMGRTTMKTKIAKSRAHLHFEVGFMLTTGFQQWYKDANYATRNMHRIWNGLNMVGIDPMDLYDAIKNGEAKSLTKYVQDLPTAFKLRIANKRVPNFIERYPTLLSTPLRKEYLQGWIIDFTWYGLPKKWTPIHTPLESTKEIALLSYDSGVMTKMKNHKMLIPKQAKGDPALGKNLKKTLNLLFKY